MNRLLDKATRDRDPRFAPLDKLTHSPILGVHLTFDRPVMIAPDGSPIPHAVLVDRPTQWLFRKNPEGTHVHAVVSAADQWLPLSEEDIGARVLADIQQCMPAMLQPSPPRLIEVRAVKEKLATFAPAPGTDALRPAATGESAIILAGDYTQTGWPATMEGAARSGYAAAAAALGLPPADFLIPPLPIAPLARIAGLRG